MTGFLSFLFFLSIAYSSSFIHGRLIFNAPKDVDVSSKKNDSKYYNITFKNAESVGSLDDAHIFGIEQLPQEYIDSFNSFIHLFKNKLNDFKNVFTVSSATRSRLPKTLAEVGACSLCDMGWTFLVKLRNLKLSRQSFHWIISTMCSTLDLEEERVCEQLVDIYIDTFLYIVDNREISSERLCGLVLQLFKCDTGGHYDWKINIPKGPQKAKCPRCLKKGSNFTVVHISDVHFDDRYTYHGNNKCHEPICCQSDQKKPNSYENECEYWGDYRKADTNKWLLEDALRQIKTQEFDYVYFTGDIPEHRIWDTTIERNTARIKQVYASFRENFNVSVFPAMGNHESHPINLFPPKNVPEKFSMEWLYKLVAEEWPKLTGFKLPDTVLDYGYYTISPKKGFRIISVNSNLAYIFNFWLLYDDDYARKHLQWVADTLKEAEDNGEKVHLIQHVTTGSWDSLIAWNREYKKIIERFSCTITGIFDGHTHLNEFHVFYDSTNTKPTGVSFNGGSLTPYSETNPDFKYVYVDKNSYNLLDYDLWTFNLTLANLNHQNLLLERAPWYKLYSFSQAYGAKSLLPSQVDLVLKRMAKNKNLLNDYNRNTHRNGDLLVEEDCDEKCHKNTICSIATGAYGDSTQCEKFTKLYDHYNSQ